jgi:hypothetical protein
MATRCILVAHSTGGIAHEKITVCRPDRGYLGHGPATTVHGYSWQWQIKKFAAR